MIPLHDFRFPSSTEISSFRNVWLDQRESSCCTLPDGKPNKNIRNEGKYCTDGKKGKNTLTWLYTWYITVFGPVVRKHTYEISSLVYFSKQESM